MKQGWVGRTLRAEIKRIFEEYHIRIIPDDSLIINSDVNKNSIYGDLNENANDVKEAAQRIISQNKTE